MIKIQESKVELSITSIYESLKNRNYKNDETNISIDNWNEFAKYTGLNKVNEPISKADATTQIIDYIKNNPEDSRQKIIDFFEWCDMDTVQSYIDKSNEIFELAVTKPEFVQDIEEKKTKNNIIKRITNTDGTYIIAVYDTSNTLQCIQISTEKSYHKGRNGLRDITEIGYYPNKICVNLDAHRFYSDINGYNDYYDMNIINKNYDFAKFANIIDKICNKI